VGRHALTLAQMGGLANRSEKLVMDSMGPPPPTPKQKKEGDNLVGSVTMEILTFGGFWGRVTPGGALLLGKKKTCLCAFARVKR